MTQQTCLFFSDGTCGQSFCCFSSSALACSAVSDLPPAARGSSLGASSLHSWIWFDDFMPHVKT